MMQKSTARRISSLTLSVAVLALWLCVIAAALAGGALIDLFGLPDPTAPMARSFDTPSAEHPLGTDHLGRDVASRMLIGNAALVLPPALAAAAASAVGLLLAVLSAVNHRAFAVIRFFGDTILAIPAILIILATVTAIPEGFTAAAVAAFALSVPMSTRYFYPAVSAALSSGYVEYARATGASLWQVSVHDILPVLRRPLIADFSIRFVAVVFLTATASFLTGATSGADSTWAAMVGAELRGVDLNPWAVVMPTLATIVLTASPALLLELRAGGQR